MTIASSQIWTPGDSPGPAPSGKRRLYIDLATGNLVMVDDAGNESPVSSGSSGTSSSAINTPTITSPADGATNIAADITSSVYATDTLFSGAHESSDWEFSVNADFSTIDHSSYGDTVHLTAYPSSLLATNTTYYARVRYNSDNHRSAWSPVISFTTAVVTVTTPTVTVTGEPTSVPETPTISTSAFSSTDTTDTHVNTDWQVVDVSGTVVWESLADSTNLESIVVPAGVLQANTTYTFKARHISSVASSFYGETTATTAASFAVSFNGSTAIVAGGLSGTTLITADTELSINIVTQVVGSVFGNLTQARTFINGLSNGTYAVFCGGGDDLTVSTVYDTMDYNVFATLATALTWGNLSVVGSGRACASDGSKGYAMGLYDPNLTPIVYSSIDVFDFSTQGNATVFGNGVEVKYAGTALSGASRIGNAGGYTVDGIRTAGIEYLDPATMVDAATFGSLTIGRHTGGGVEDTTGSRWVVAGGHSGAASDVIDYVEAATLGNATVFGNLPVGTYYTNAVSDGSTALNIGGKDTEYTDAIYSFTIATLGNATTLSAVLPEIRALHAATSGN